MTDQMLTKTTELELSSENDRKEKEIQSEINDNLYNRHSILFNAGAGSGKTHALKESLCYLIKNPENTSIAESLYRHNQKIMCITYTNAATDEIKERVGESDLIEISTIHEMLWKLIKQHQKQLVDIHEKMLVIY